MKMLQIYLDHCCLNRLFDDQIQERVKMETEVVKELLLGHEAGRWVILVSEVHKVELEKCESEQLRDALSILLSRLSLLTAKRPELEREIVALMKLGLKELDAAHIVCADSHQADRFLTCDDGILKKADRINQVCKRVKVESLLDWLQQNEERKQ
jgi:hypothetical protein